MTLLPDGGLRVALLTQGFNTGGGVPAVTRWLRAGLEDLGHEVEIVDLANSSRDRNSRRLLAPWSWFRFSLEGSSTEDGVRKWGANLVEIEAMRYRPRLELDRLLNTFDLVHVVSGTPALARVARRVTVPVLLKTATMVRWERQAVHARARVGPASLWRRLMTALHERAELPALLDAHIVFAINDFAADHIAQLGQPAVVVAPPGVDVDLYAPHPGGWRSSGPLLSVCRLGDARKGLDRLVLAYAELVRMGSDVPDLVLAGRGRLEATAQSLIVELGLSDRIHVRSDVPVDELPVLMRSASVFLQSSHEEGLGISVLEAMASGLPIVATDTHGSRQTIDPQVTGFLIPQESEHQIVSDFAQHIVLLLGGSGAQMGLAARARAVSQFSKASTLAKITSGYSLALGTSND